MDFILIEDTKKEVALVNGQKWVGINFVHGHDHMRLDIQSLIHLQEFLDIDNLEGYVQEEGKLFVESLQNGATNLRRDKGDNLSSVIPRETRNLWPTNKRFLVSLGMTSGEVSRLKWVAQNGTAGRAMKRIDKNETVEDIQNWAVREFVACGGDVRWSPQLIKSTRLRAAPSPTNTLSG